MPPNQRRLLRQALLSSYSNFDELRRLVRNELGDRLIEVPPGIALGPGIDGLIDWAGERGTLDALHTALFADRPGNPDMQAYRKSLTPQAGAESNAATAPPSGLEATIQKANVLAETEQWRQKMAAAESRVCRIESPAGHAIGTGFLVGPDLVLTNEHVNAAIEWNSAVARFDYKSVNTAGQPCRFAKAALVVSPAKELDYALLRLTERPGDQRGWFTSQPHQFTPGEAQLILQHPNGDPLKLGVGVITAALEIPWPRIAYTTNTLPGSSGSPAFTMNWELVAIHHYGKEGVNNAGIPLPPIWKELQVKKLVGAST